MRGLVNISLNGLKCDLTVQVTILFFGIKVVVETPRRTLSAKLGKLDPTKPFILLMIRGLSFLAFTPVNNPPNGAITIDFSWIMGMPI